MFVTILGFRTVDVWARAMSTRIQIMGKFTTRMKMR